MQREHRMTNANRFYLAVLFEILYYAFIGIGTMFERHINLKRSELGKNRLFLYSVTYLFMSVYDNNK